MTAVFVMLFGLLCLVLGVGGAVLWIWIFIDCVMNEPTEGNRKIIWIPVIVLLGPFGAVVYLLSRRPTRLSLCGR